MFLVPSVVSVSNICRWNVNVANSSEALRVTDDNDQDPKGISGAQALVQRDTELMLGCSELVYKCVIFQSADIPLCTLNHT